MSGDGLHILLIDDDTDMHDVVRLILEPAGYRVVCCTTVPAGLEMLHDGRPDLLLLDIMLATPTEGLELAERLNADPRFRGLPIIMVSSAPRDAGFDEPGQRRPARIRPDQFLEKPLKADVLRRAVANALGAS